ncbi:MAG TPA: sigma-70 family RNA polymerase sigma factor [Gaiellaceae bacterium]|nr:sigma-70 family RNA polymerase sigma factor [Gaiellaceae bacterium]
MAVTEAGHAAARALDDLYRRYGGDVYRYAFAVLGNRADAEDVTQTTFLNAYRALEQGVRPRQPANWLLTIASNAIKARFRREGARPREVALETDLPGGSADEDAPTVGELLTALARIPPQQRQALVLREFEGRSYKEIAAILNVTTSALETLLFRARRSLAEELTHNLTCSDAQLAISRAADRRLGRKERRRLREHLDDCPDCARFARVQGRHRAALRSLLLVPVPLSLGLFKGFEGSAAAAVLPTAAVASAGVGTGVGVGAGAGGIFAGGLAKAAAVVTAATVAGGVGVSAATEQGASQGPKISSPALVKPGKSATAPGRLVDNGRANGKAEAPGQARASGGPAPGQVRDRSARGVSEQARGRTRAVPARPARPQQNRTSVPARARTEATRSAKEPKPVREPRGRGAERRPGSARATTP